MYYKHEPSESSIYCCFSENGNRYDPYQTYFEHNGEVAQGVVDDGYEYDVLVKRQAEERQTGEEFSAAGPPRCRIRRVPCSNRRQDGGYQYSAVTARSPVTSMIHYFIKTYITPYHLAKLSAALAAVIAFIGTYLIP